MMHTLGLELEAPRLRREAFPWDVADVELSAILSSNKATTTTSPTTAGVATAATTATTTATTTAAGGTGALVVADCDRTINSSTLNVRLPSVVDLSAFWPVGGCTDSRAEGHHHAVQEKQLEVEILGCDLGIMFTLGTASIQVPSQLKPSIDQNACRSSPFRVCLWDDAGARVGTVSGAFLARRRGVLDAPPSMAQRHAGVKQSTAQPAVKEQSEAGDSAAAIFRREGAADDIADRASLLGDMKASEEPAAKHDDREVLFENKAIELLDMASKILASANYNSLAHGRDRDPAGPKEMASCDSVFEDGEAMRSPLLQGQEKQATGLVKHFTSNIGSKDHAYVDSGEPGLSPNRKDMPLKDNEQKTRAPRFPTAGFRFEPTTGSVAWHRIAAVNASKVERDGDLQSLKQFIADIAVGQVDEDDIDANPGLIKAFRLAQLQVQYVLHCQQILQRHCDGLQSTTTNMQLEVEGNSQSTTAMKSRVRLLRKESRKQDKIISGYSNMLRKHNPGLASKVRLDERGRLRTFRVDEAAREWGGGGQRRRRNREQCDIDGLQVLRVESRVKGSNTSRSPTGSSSPVNDNRWAKEDRSRFSTISESHRQQRPTTSAPGPHVDGRRERIRTNDPNTRKSHQDEKGSTDDSVDCGQETFVFERGGGVDHGDAGSGGRGDSLEPDRSSGRDAVRLSEESTAPRTQDEGRKIIGKGGDRSHLPHAAIPQTIEDNRKIDPPRKNLSHVSPPKVDVHDAGRGGAHGVIRNASITANMPGQSQNLGGSIAHMSVSNREGGDNEGLDSPGEWWRRQERDVTHNRSVSAGVHLDGKAQPGLEDANQNETGFEKAGDTEPVGEDAKDTSGSRAPRLVTVSVKPRRQQQSSSPESTAFNFPRFRRGEDSEADSKADSKAVAPGGGPASQNCAASGTLHPVDRGGGRNAGEESGARLTRGVHSSPMPGVSSGRRLGEAGGEHRRNSSAAAGSSLFSPSQLGIEGEGYPDALEFDLDDISEIDAGGEWEAEEEEGSSSSSS